ncbi:MAG: sortase, partial [Chloroflexi bacterium]|nr:sortase [Chloroflexota bacterium]
SAAVSLTPGSVGAQSNNTVTQSSGTTSNPTIDFGFTVTTYSLGNRVWFDTNNNSQIDAGEVGVNGVVVELYAADLLGNPILPALATDTTANGGYYLFDTLAAGNYIVSIAASNFAPGGALESYWSSATTMDGSGAVSETAAPDGDNDTDSEDNGTLNLFGALPGAVTALPVTLGPGNVEPVGESDLESGVGQGIAPDLRANMTVDFGFYRVELGNLIFVDVNANGAYDSGTDTPLAGATVQLFAANGSTEITVGPDGILGTADDAPGGMTTGANGLYLFSGLPQGSYIVRATPPVGYSSTVDTADNADTANPDTNTDNNDNGVGVGVGQAASNVVTLTPGSSGAASNNTVVNSTGSTLNPTVDFGFTGNNGAVTKTLVGTNETFTTDPDVAIGEILTYEVLVNLPVGTPLTSVTLTDQMDKGLAFVDCLLAEVAGVDQTAAICSSAVVSPLVDSGDPPSNPANPGRQVVFTIGDIPAQTSAATLRIQYRAIVLDVIENQDGVDLNNNAAWAFTGGSFSASAPEVNIIEPDLVIDKSATPSAGVPLGTPIQFTLTINHSLLSATDAFDVVVTDILPPELEYIPCSIVYSGLAPTTPAAPAYCPASTSNLIFQWDVFPLGSTATITFNARLVSSPASNSANVAWTSLEIDPQLTGDPVQLSVYNDTSTERWYDPLDDVNIYAVSDSVTINAPAADVESDDEEVSLPASLPATGFAPNRITLIPEQPAEMAYRETNVWLEIPRLGLKMPIVGVPLIEEDWNLTWLWDEAGWLEGTAFPGWSGNSVLTGHTVLPNGQEGPFAELGKLRWGDTIIIHAFGTAYTYEARTNRIVKPFSIGVLQHEDTPWLTLLTCKDYNEASGLYSNRIAVRAVLVRTMEDKNSGSSNMR